MNIHNISTFHLSLWLQHKILKRSNDKFIGQPTGSCYWEHVSYKNNWNNNILYKIFVRYTNKYNYYSFVLGEQQVSNLMLGKMPQTMSKFNTNGVLSDRRICTMT